MVCFVDYPALKELPKYTDYFQASETFIEERFTTYSTQMRGITKDMADLIIDCRAKFRAAELKAERDSIKKIDKFNTDWKHL
jgi:hypothetical protein